MSTKLTDWKIDEALDTPKAQAQYLMAAIEQGDFMYALKALANVARVNGFRDLHLILDGFIMGAEYAQHGQTETAAPRTARHRTNKRELAKA